MKSDQLQTFYNNDIGEIRGFIKDGEPWFLAGNVCRCLGIKNTSEALRKIRTKRKESGVKGIISSDTLLDTNGGMQTVSIIPEKILYELIFQSRKKKAYLFQTWVYDEVLPSLRKFGFYRNEGKLIRRTLTDSIKDSSENERMHGHGFSTYTKLVYKSLGINYKDGRDSLTVDQLNSISRRENLVKSLLDEKLEYSDIKDVLFSLMVN